MTKPKAAAALLALVSLFTLACLTDAALAEPWLETLKPILHQHCVDCHEGEDASGELDLTKLASDLGDLEIARRWTVIHDRIAAGEMPPKEQAPLTKAEKTASVNTLHTALTAASLARNSVVLRRLNRVEYENTVSDLFDVYVSVKEQLPEDTPTAGFDNVGEGLAVSAEAMRAYLRAADITLDAVFGPDKSPKYILHETSLRDQKSHDGKPQLASQYGKMFRLTEDGLVIFQSGYCPTNLVNFARLRASAGTYRGTIRVRAVQSDEPVTLRVYGGDTIVGRREKHLVGYYDIPPDEWTTIEFEDRLMEDGGTYQPKCYNTKDTRKDADTFPEPGLEIAEITIEGPLEEWPPRSRILLLGDVDPEQATLADVETILREVLPRAFRREVQPEECVPYIKLAESALADGRSFTEALRLGLKGILCSPEFLFLDEPGDAEISQYALASRLSYFLWSSMPDYELLRTAGQGKLKDKQILHQQVERMLKSPRAKAFTVNFTGQWLDMRLIDFTSPDQKLYPEFDELLNISMVEETHRFFEEMLDQDLSVANVVDSDFAILNERLARHYGIEGVRGQEFRKVSLSADSVRGGFMTQGSVLKVTANGTTTSPVLRGAWVLDKLLGQPSPPPPANAPTVEPDIRGATTLREQLAKHRNSESCAVCHQKIDPPGFALENFDVIGAWREKYRTLGEGERPAEKQAPFTNAWIRYRIGLPVDATGQTADGKPFQDIREFKQLLLSDREAVVRGLTEKMLTYGMGRQLVFSDRPAVEAIVQQLGKGEDGLRRMVHTIVQSETFRRP